MKKSLFIIFLIAATGMIVFGQEKQGQQIISAQAHRVATPTAAAHHVPLQIPLFQTAGPVERIFQLARDQYDSQAEYDAYSYSACSVAAMAEVMNAYGLHLRVAPVLNKAIALHEITPELGMLNGEQSIARTVASFGFQARDFTSHPLSELLSLAKHHHPVIIGFPPSRWLGGHVLILRGGDSQYLSLVDSSRLNIQAMNYTTFIKYWVGFAVLVTPAGKGGVQ